MTKSPAVDHAYGDSYAHARPEKDGGRAYGQLFGHALWDSWDHPDKISSDPGKYTTYVRQLYSTLETGKTDPIKLESFIRDVHMASAVSDPKMAERQLETVIESYVGQQKPLGKSEWNQEIGDVDEYLKELQRILEP